MKFRELDEKIQELTSEADTRKSLDIAIEIANAFIRILNPAETNLLAGEDALDEIIPASKFPNQKAESWFASHPYFPSNRVALQLFSSEFVETKFYWLNESATKSRVSAGVMLTPNWEDSELTRNEEYKIGVDFFLSANAKSLLIVVSNNGNMRILELSEKLSHTQIEILEKLQNSLTLDGKEKIHDVLWNALALSEVNKRFYAGIAEQFNILHNHLIANGRDKEDSKLFASRVLGRLLFIWFLRKKGLINDKYEYFSLEDVDSTSYYDNKLKKLFFSTLNTPEHDRKTEDVETPYLNGGLFEAHENDWPHETVSFPTGFFNGLYEHLEKYNFTTDESSPEYEQVAIDPEMLGRVFESLLATQLTETGEQARKAKGAFYTPREIVAYMCRESLRQYLYTKLDNAAWNVGVDKLLDHPDAEWELAHSNAKRDLWGEANRNTVPLKVIGALNDLTVLDPACGSGAYPMGMLQLVLKTYERLDPTYDPYKKKLQIIQNNLFGVDIEPMAVEISRLRAWLSLIVEEEDGRMLEPLPNLDFKFICADSLIQLEQLEQTAIFSDPTLHEKLSELRAKFFNARKPEMKDKWRNEYFNLVRPGQQILYADRRDTQLRSFDPFKNAQNAEFFDADYMFGINKFDIVIANPPYLGEKGHKELFRKIKKDGLSEFYIGKMDLFYFFFHHALNLNTEKGITTFITTNYYPTADGAIKLRKDFYKRTNVIELINFNEYKIFESALGQHNLIALLQKESVPDQNYKTKQTYVRVSGGPNANELKGFLAHNSDGASFSQVERKNLFEGDKSYIRMLDTNGSTGLNALLQKISSSSRRLADVARINAGADITLSKITKSIYGKYPSTDYGVGDGVFVLSPEEINNIQPSNEIEIYKNFIKNSDVIKFGVTTNSDRLIYLGWESSPSLYPRTIGYLERFRPILEDQVKRFGESYPWFALHRPRDKEIFESRGKIIVPYRSKRNIFGYTNSPIYSSRDVLHINQKKDGLDLIYLLGILNSKLMYTWLFNKGKRKGNTLELVYAPLSEIPIKTHDEKTHRDVIALVQSIIKIKSEDPEADTSGLESEIDKLAYKIYDLTSEEIKIIEESNT